MTEHAHQHIDAAPEGRSCCSDTLQARAREARAPRVVVIVGLAALALAIIGLVLGGWAGAVLVFAIAGGIAATLAGSWPRLSLNDRLMRVAVTVLLVGLALVRAIPR